MFRVRIPVQLPTLSHSYRYRRQPATRVLESIRVLKQYCPQDVVSDIFHSVETITFATRGRGLYRTYAELLLHNVHRK